MLFQREKERDLRKKRPSLEFSAISCAIRSAVRCGTVHEPSTMTKSDNRQRSLVKICFLLSTCCLIAALDGCSRGNETALLSGPSTNASTQCNNLLAFNSFDNRQKSAATRNATVHDLRPLRRSTRSARKARKPRAKSAKRKVKRLVVLRVENFPFLKLFAARKLIRKRFVRRNARGIHLKSRFNRARFKVGCQCSLQHTC